MGRGENIFIKLVSRLLILHVLVCVVAFCLLLGTPVVVWNFIDSLSVPDRLIGEAEKIEVPIVWEKGTGYSKRQGKHWCHIAYAGGVYTFLRDKHPEGLTHLTVYAHDSMREPRRSAGGNVAARIVEVPEPETWENVYQAYCGKTPLLAGVGVAVWIACTAFAVFLAVGGYFAIRKKRTWRRERV